MPESTNPTNPPKKKKKTQKQLLKEAQESLVVASEELEEYKDRTLRAEAEMQNVRKRAVREMENAHKYGTERLIERLLPTVDSMEKAIQSWGDEYTIEGIEICLKMLLDVLAKEKVVQLDPLGECFDPQFHKAISVIAVQGEDPNTVMTVAQKGYTLNGRVVRPAMVIVSKTP